MSVDPRRGRPYQYQDELSNLYPADSLPAEQPNPLPPPERRPEQRLEYDNVPQQYTSVSTEGQIPYDPAEYGDIGPLHGTPEADAWLKENVTDKGWVVDWGDRSIIAEDGSIMGYVPKYFPRMT